ncbi:hypothetical protein AIOL_004043 [Candidatus Rhodobacter oscarellae]|uniref:Uncharacterized protein n=1 Tax=Candidatus Rhodobacter oscarellae TaxID=1675527 RepID=A0A0J9E8I5_9RHOB|nr:hypothetical protein AIOL_004043 [Candidatus Rhodobacter lobularis]
MATGSFARPSAAQKGAADQQYLHRPPHPRARQFGMFY